MNRREEPESPTLARALAYARHGWPVFPCKPGSKEPATAHGHLDATTDPARIADWWRAVPVRNVAIATGAPGPDVLDIDVRPEGSGYPAWRRLQHAAWPMARSRWSAPPAADCTPTTAELLSAAAGSPASTSTSKPPADTPRHLPAQQQDPRRAHRFQGSRRVRPRPAVPDRRFGLPPHRIAGRPEIEHRLGQRSPACSPRTTTAAGAKPSGMRPLTPASWPPGSPRCQKATGTPACSGQRAGPPKPASRRY